MEAGTDGEYRVQKVLRENEELFKAKVLALLLPPLLLLLPPLLRETLLLASCFALY